MSLNENICFFLSWDIFLWFLWCNIVNSYCTASMQMGADKSFWLNWKLPWMVSFTDIQQNQRGPHSLALRLISKLWQDVSRPSSSTSFMQSVSEGNRPVNMAHTVATVFPSADEAQRSSCVVSACKLMWIIWAKTNYLNSKCWLSVIEKVCGGFWHDESKVGYVLYLILFKSFYTIINILSFDNSRQYLCLLCWI